VATVTARIEVRWRWWLRWYLLGLRVTSQISGLEPDPAKIEPWIRRGLYVVVKR
jgi:hypothetical protein